MQVLDAGLWTLDLERWTLDAGLWTLDSERWTLDAGSWRLDFDAGPVLIDTFVKWVFYREMF